jgi:hypothetical protein
MEKQRSKIGMIVVALVAILTLLIAGSDRLSAKEKGGEAKGTPATSEIGGPAPSEAATSIDPAEAPKPGVTETAQSRWGTAQLGGPSAAGPQVSRWEAGPFPCSRP